MTGTYTTPPISRGRYGAETTTRERWRLHSLQRIPFAPLFFYGIREDNGQLVQVHEHGIEFDPVPNDPSSATRRHHHERITKDGPEPGSVQRSVSRRASKH